MVARVVFGVNTPALGTITHTNRMSDAHFERLMAAYTAILASRSGTPLTPQQVVEELSQRLIVQMKNEVLKFEQRAAATSATSAVGTIDTAKE
jgi:hypothetical protein